MINTKLVIPVGKMILYKELKRGTTEGGVLIPEKAQKEYGCKVVEIGDKVTSIKKGDIILHASPTISRVTYEGIEEGLCLIEEDKIIARIQSL